MPSTTVIEAGPKPELHLTLQNGQSIRFHSDTAIDAHEIPVTYLQGMYSDNIEDRKVVAEQIREAEHRIGFLYIVNHGIDGKYAENTFHQAKRFFGQEEQKKLEVCTDLVEYLGYFLMARYNRNGKRKNVLMEAYNWGFNPKTGHRCLWPKVLWPKDLPGFKDTLYKHHARLLTLARKLTRIFEPALHLEEDHSDKDIRTPAAGMRPTYYPPQEASASEQLGIGAHTDFECFTFVTQDTHAGLEVLSKSGYWIKAKPIPGSIVVNTADCFMRQTNDFFVSTVHRVVNKGGAERYSCPVFFGWDHDMELEPVPTCCGLENPIKYPVITSGEYLKWRGDQAKKV
ncbi:putative isopenicillin N synthetase [Clohesyomyces aquaticus]|uniref:Putative isopenicillin N synthetase n=1 Tax=Clohesyomyces aquaticus TaxID=1231657 RepID=A0A1Y1YTS9_9PLEO|nr:putative isopenicillin N synthetase [Clohesyomyces aquaticus]